MRWGERIDGARRGRVVLGVCAVLAAVYLATATYTMVQINDARASAITAWSLAEGHGFTLPAQWEDVPWREESVDGETLTDRFPGTAILAAPFYAVWPDAGEPLRSLDVNYAPAGVAAAVITAAAMAVLFVALDGLVRRRAALVTVALVALGTATWSVSADSLFTHGPGQLMLALGLLGVQRSRWLLAGLAFGGAVVVRPQLAVIAAVVGVGIALSRRSIRPALGIGATSVLGAVAMSLYTHHFFGSWIPIAGYSSAKFTRVTGAVDVSQGTSWLQDLWMVVEHWGFTLFHPLRGLLLYSPFLLVLGVFAVLAWRKAPDWVCWAAVAGVVAMTVQLFANPTWHGGDDFFAYRLPLEMVTVATPLFALGAARVLDDGLWPRFALALTGCASIVMFALGTTSFDPRQDDAGPFLERVEELGPHGEGYRPDEGAGLDDSTEGETASPPQ